MHMCKGLYLVCGEQCRVCQQVGDVATQQFSTAMANAREWTAQTQESLRADLEEYVHEEARLLPSGAETRIFAERLDELKLALDRIQARAARLRQNVAEQASRL